MDQQTLATRQFGSTAQRYLTSAVHSSGADLDRLERSAVASHAGVALDLGCGAGHVSFALARRDIGRVVAYDLSPQMLEVVAQEAIAKNYRQIETQRGEAQRLPHADATFDLVVTRYSAHHWLDVGTALREVWRVLQPGGTFIAIDVLAPESPLLDTVLQTLEILRDESHVRDYRGSEWCAMFEAAGFAAPQTDRWKLPMEFDAWVARIGTSPPRIDALQVVIDALPREARDYFAVRDDRSFDIDAAWLEATKP